MKSRIRLWAAVQMDGEGNRGDAPFLPAPNFLVCATSDIPYQRSIEKWQGPFLNQRCIRNDTNNY
jgi:hypothetical protein